MSVAASKPAGLIVDALSLIVGRGNIAEIRILGVDGRKNRTDSGYFDDFEVAAKAVIPYAKNNKTKGCYVVLNKINPALLARSKNRISTYAEQTTSDHDILQRNWLYIDCDPVRPSGISATEAECEAAHDRANAIADWLMIQGLNEPVVAMSGNGSHLQLPVDLPNDDESTSLVKSILSAASAKFSDGAVSVDESVFNAARICRLYGTPARKGDHTDERPHRISSLVHVPDYIRSYSSDS